VGDNHDIDTHARSRSTISLYAVIGDEDDAATKHFLHPPFLPLHLEPQHRDFPASPFFQLTHLKHLLRPQNRVFVTTLSRDIKRNSTSIHHIRKSICALAWQVVHTTQPACEVRLLKRHREGEWLSEQYSHPLPTVSRSKLQP
jgi:hypothetical protein